jgi:hypothetical protein
VTRIEFSEAVRDIRNALSDPMRLVRVMGLEKGAKPQHGYVLVCCPAHGDRDPSCSISRGPDGTARARCFSCDWSADAIGVIAMVHGLSTRGDQFREVLIAGAEAAGLLELAYQLRRPDDVPLERRPVPVPAPVPDPEYPESAELEELWSTSVPVEDDRDGSRVLVKRKIDPVEVSLRDLARSIPDGTELPEWARYRGKPWTRTGHRVLLRVFDHCGVFKSVRAWRVIEGDTPKRLPPAGRKASGLVLANRMALGMLRRQVCPLELVIVEGEPDFLVACTSWRPGVAVIGIGSGSWTQDFARAVPAGTSVAIATDNDHAGDRYADAIEETLGPKRKLWRWRASA